MLSSRLLTLVRSVIVLASLLAGREAVAQQPVPTPKHRDLHALVRPAIQADSALQALQPPAVAYVWFQATPDGHVVASGRDTSRVSLLRHAAALGKVTAQGFAPAGVLAPAKMVYAWIEVSGKP